MIPGIEFVVQMKQLFDSSSVNEIQALVQEFIRGREESRVFEKEVCAVAFAFFSSWIEESRVSLCLCSKMTLYRYDMTEEVEVLDSGELSREEDDLSVSSDVQFKRQLVPVMVRVCIDKVFFFEGSVSVV